MKLLTINAHSHLGENCRQKVNLFVQYLLHERPDLVALQEVSQTCNAPRLEAECLQGQYPQPGHITVRRDNFVAQTAMLLRREGIECHWVWLPVKRSYGRYDEGVAFLSLGRPISGMDSFPITRIHEFTNWRTRKVLGIRLEGLEDWFYCVQTGWWSDRAEPFLDQWRVLNCCVASKRICAPVWLMGDFNAPTCFRGESYDAIRSSGWVDTYHSAREKDRGITVMQDAQNPGGLRQDFIWCSQEWPVYRSQVVLDGVRGCRLSSHFGVQIEAGLVPGEPSV